MTALTRRQNPIILLIDFRSFSAARGRFMQPWECAARAPSGPS